MKTILALFLFCCFAFMQEAAAQTTDSTSTVQSKPAPPANHWQAMRERRPGFGPTSAPFEGQPARDARHNTRQFRLPKDLVPKVRDGEIPATSDYFKPTAASTPIPEMLADSAYVKDYRYYAYIMGSRQMAHPARTGLIIGGSILVAVVGFVALVVALSHAVHIHPTMY